MPSSLSLQVHAGSIQPNIYTYNPGLVPDTNIYKLPATNLEEQSSTSTLQPSVTNPGIAYPQPVNTGVGQQMKETQFVPASDVATHYSVNQPPSYDSIFET